MQAKPFGRALLMMRAITAALALPLAMQQAAMAKIGDYKSRGHGRGVYSGRKKGNQPSGKFDGVSNGQRERERRMRQIQRGIIAVST